MVATGAPRTPLTREQEQSAASIYDEYDRRREENQKLLSEKVAHSRRRDAIWIRFRRALMENIFVPLIFRLFVLATSVTAMSLGATIFYHFQGQYQEENPKCKKGETTYMAVIVGAFAIVYTTYITYDEFSSKPLGLRRPSSKLRLLLLDLIFLIFMSANVSLAWDALTSGTFPCANTPTQCATDEFICKRQKALIAVLMISIIAWLSTFVVSLYRLVYHAEKILSKGNMV
jgi:hypothetical protein